MQEWISKKALAVLKENMKPWVWTVVTSNLPIPLALELYSPYRENHDN